jgi:phenylacetate-coenzyme A ligase PaaK-like adenylate-forming protein
VTTPAEIEHRLRRLNEKLADYIPPRETWTPADKALFKPRDLFRVPLDEAQEMQFKAIKHAFTRHYTYNRFYREYCKVKGVTPDDLKTADDFDKIPLIPDSIFKQHHSGKDLAYWITGIFTGDLPHIVIKGANPRFDDVINAFNEQAGLAVTYSSGTSGRHTVIPRDIKTFLAAEYAMAKLMVCMSDDLMADHSLLLVPKHTNSNLWVAKGLTYQSEVYSDVHYALDLEISADLAHKAATSESQRANAPRSAEARERTIVENAVEWFERYDKTEDTIRLISPPFLLSHIMDEFEREGKRCEFGERGTIITGGGWKMSEDKRLAPEDFRKRIEQVLGVPATRCTEMYVFTEMNGHNHSCPEGHYFHLPHTYLKPFVLDGNLTPASYDEPGRFAFFDALAGSYPGFIITGDEVRMLEHCPVCDRPGPVLDPVIRRVRSVEGRGCSAVLQNVLERELEA